MDIKKKTRCFILHTAVLLGSAQICKVIYVHDINKARNIPVPDENIENTMPEDDVN